MTGLSVLTLVRNRDGHLRQLVEGLRRSARPPDELIVVDMSDVPVSIAPQAFPVRIERLGTASLALAAARNLAASRARHENLVFLDVDCIALSACLSVLCDVILADDVLACADVRYLGPDDARQKWSEADLLRRGRVHPVRDFPTAGTRLETNPGLFWSLAFAIRRTRFAALGGFDEAYEGYGAEDTDFGFRAAAAGVPLVFVGGAIACHQHHASHEPPVQHVGDIVRNATIFYDRWGRWPMEGWLAALDEMGLVAWRDDEVKLLRAPTAADLRATEVGWAPTPTQPALDAPPVARASGRHDIGLAIPDKIIL